MTPFEIALGDPEDRLYRNLPGGRYDNRFRRPPFRVNKDTSELLMQLGAKPFTGERNRTERSCPPAGVELPLITL